MSGATPIYVLDCYALYAYFQAQVGGDKVEKLVKDAWNQDVNLYLSMINYAELYYVTYKKLGKLKANSIRTDTQNLPIQIEGITETEIFGAAELKAHYNISFADAFAAHLAQKLDAILVTGDPEFEEIEAKIKVLWLGK
jgi:predicted nucleic acid-binding protein